jgi:hypothetical protein
MPIETGFPFPVKIFPRLTPVNEHFSQRAISLRWSEFDLCLSPELLEGDSELYFHPSLDEFSSSLAP